MSQALRDFLVKNHEGDTETLQLISLHHSMFRAIGEHRLQLAITMLRSAGSAAPGPARIPDLIFVIQLLSKWIKVPC